jgi:phosphatidate phosphatase APP1
MPPWVFIFAAFLGGVFSIAGTPKVCELKADEEIVFYPTIAMPATNGGWKVHIHGCVFERERARLQLTLLRQLLDLKGVEMTAAELATFKERARLFFADNERGHRVVVRVGDQTFDLGKSAPNGRFEQTVHLATLPHIADGLPPASLEIVAVLKEADKRRFVGRVMVVPRGGVSVVSDVDDTIKISDVLDHRALVRRTFLQPFEPVPGMAELYRGWASNGAVFHYVSASPWQLFQPLVEFTRTNAFPAGSWSLKQWRIKDRTFTSLFEDPQQYKIGRISVLLRQFPERRFVLVGDSGERDPEAYAALAREFPAQVKGIFIRDVTGQGPEVERYRTNFAGLPRELWRIFKEPQELAPRLP